MTLTERQLLITFLTGALLVKGSDGGNHCYNPNSCHEDYECCEDYQCVYMNEDVGSCAPMNCKADEDSCEWNDQCCSGTCLYPHEWSDSGTCTTLDGNGLFGGSNVETGTKDGHAYTYQVQRRIDDGLDNGHCIRHHDECTYQTSNDCCGSMVCLFPYPYHHGDTGYCSNASEETALMKPLSANDLDRRRAGCTGYMHKCDWDQDCCGFSQVKCVRDSDVGNPPSPWWGYCMVPPSGSTTQLASSNGGKTRTTAGARRRVGLQDFTPFTMPEPTALATDVPTAARAAVGSGSGSGSLDLDEFLEQLCALLSGSASGSGDFAGSFFGELCAMGPVSGSGFASGSGVEMLEELCALIKSTGSASGSGLEVEFLDELCALLPQSD